MTSAAEIQTAPAPHVDTAMVLETYRRHIGRGRARIAAMTGAAIEVASSGAHVWDSTGRRYLDCGGYGVFLLGHAHPDVTEAVIGQIRRHPMATRLLLEPTAATAAAALAEVTPAGLDYVHFVNSGAEATETAIKLARAHGKHVLVSATGGYHGKTTGALALTARPVFQEPFRPLLDSVHVPYGDPSALETVLAERHGQACVVVEPVQGEGGVVVPPPGYLTRVQELCRAYGAMFVLDEIQTGLGRLGSWWGADDEGVRPDILLVGKNLSGGVVPVAAAVATAEAYAPLDNDPFLHTSTFAGAPVAMAAAAAAVRVIARDGLVTRAAGLGERIRQVLDETLGDLRGDVVTDIRGRGLLLGVELADEALAGQLMLHLLEAGVVVNHSLNAHRVVRLTPPAVLTDRDLDELHSALRTAAQQLTRHATTHRKAVRRA
ncbi:aspartate aminotransferase family protein [Micromonospora sp. DT48]|uniref:aspartate aminotransferase family protein n=1 Tax=unclassified Micromonospora TaxID=2617518 RepID=UPI0012BCF1D0|nr:aminotransferase class III-fold pyridoxal phosphate-dependent enzyme [Micromonospora sp. CP22]MTK03716.1 aspartate aminotransferase family protein [Micromonospora sp. CP22]